MLLDGQVSQIIKKIHKNKENLSEHETNKNNFNTHFKIKMCFF